MFGTRTYAAATPRARFAGQNDLLQPRHFFGAESQRPLGAHFHPRPAILIMAGGHHRHARRVERELGKIGDRRERKPDVVHGASRGHKAERSACLMLSE